MIISKKSFLQKIGLKRGRGRPQNPIRFTNTIPSSLVRKRKKKDIKLTKREKKIALANVEGAGIGYVVGTAVGGIGGMFLGVPAGVLAGNIIGKKIAGKQVGRPLEYRKTKFLDRVLSTRQSRVEYNRQMKRVKKK